MSRRPLAALALLAATAACAPVSPSVSVTPAPSGDGPAGAASTTARATSTRPAPPSPSPTPACRSAAAALSTAALAHQVIVVGVDPSLAAPDPETARLLAAGVGGVVYLPGTVAPATTVAQLSAGLHGAAAIKPLITVDQEGGKVVRFTGPGFSPIPSAAQQAASTPAQLRQQATAWGTELKAAGVDVDLAPVADVVDPAFVTSNQPVSLLGRGYGTDPTIVSGLVGAFADGMRAGGTGVTLKHYPGLGASVANTDFGAATDDTTTLDAASLRPFRDNAAKADLVMVSTVRYTRVDPERRAAFSPVVMKAIRDDLAFAGPVISDDLGSAVAVADLAPGERATAFVAAGGDLVITVDPALVDAMASALAAKAEAEPAFKSRLRDAVERILTLKERRGLHHC